MELRRPTSRRSSPAQPAPRRRPPRCSPHARGPRAPRDGAAQTGPDQVIQEAGLRIPELPTKPAGRALHSLDPIGGAELGEQRLTVLAPCGEALTPWPRQDVVRWLPSLTCTRVPQCRGSLERSGGPPFDSRNASGNRFASAWSELTRVNPAVTSSVSIDLIASSIVVPFRSVVPRPMCRGMRRSSRRAQASADAESRARPATTNWVKPPPCGRGRLPMHPVAVAGCERVPQTKDSKGASCHAV